MSREPLRRYPRTLRRQVSTSVAVEQTRPPRRLLRIESLPFILIAGFAAAIALGTLLLMLPVSSGQGEWTPPLTAFFIATSSVCVTGLTPVDTAVYWSDFGHVVIMLLVQFGGLGFMTSATLVFLFFGWRVGLRERLLISQSLDISRLGGVVRLTRSAVLFTLVMELAGFIALTTRFAMDEPLGKAAWWGLFHSVAAFNNAGFDLFGGFHSLEYHADAFTLTTISVLIVVGGIGFLVVQELLDRSRLRLSLDTRIVLVTSGTLLLLGFAGYLALEWDSSMAAMPLPEKALHAAFNSVTARTAGFSTIPVTQMEEASQFLTMGLMFIGGGSGSTAGGIKVVTLAIMVAATISTIRGRPYTEIADREIVRGDVDRAFAVTVLSATLVFCVAVLLASFHNLSFHKVLYETTSAFGTTGLTAGVTTELKDQGLLIVALMMFVGRLGPLTLVLAMVQRAGPQRRRLPEERVRIG